MKVGIFLNTVGHGRNGEKKHILYKFKEGVEKTQDSVFLYDKDQYKKCDIAVIFGFFGKNLGHIQRVRKKIYREHTKRGKRCVFIDADPFRHAGKIKPKSQLDLTHYFRISFGSIYPGDAYYFNENSPSDRWEIIKNKKKIEVKPWVQSTDNNQILICMNSNSVKGRGWATKGINTDLWLEKKIREIRYYTDDPIKVRFHPGGKDEDHKSVKWKHLIKYQNISFSGGIIGKSSLIDNTSSLLDDCLKSKACVVLTSSSSVIPVLNGIPVFTDNNDCISYPVSNKNIKNINNPTFFDRKQWLYNLSYTCWNSKEISNGILWNRFRNRLNIKGDYSKNKARKLGLI